MKYIELPSGQTFTLDNQDYDQYGHYNWFWAGSGVSRNATVAEQAAGSSAQIILARELLGLPRRSGRDASAVYADHLDGDKLNNTRSNLRPVSPLGNKQNCANYSNRAGRTSKYRGVSKSRNGWQARVRFDGKDHSLGVYATEVEAANAAQAARLLNMTISNETRHHIDRSALRAAQARAAELEAAKAAARNAPCAVDGCEATKHARGYCNKHYARVMRLGSTELAAKPDQTFTAEADAYRAHRLAA